MYSLSPCSRCPISRANEKVNWQAKLTMEKAQHLMSVAKQMHDVAERLAGKIWRANTGRSLSCSQTEPWKGCFTLYPPVIYDACTSCWKNTEKSFAITYSKGSACCDHLFEWINRAIRQHRWTHTHTDTLTLAFTVHLCRKYGMNITICTTVYAGYFKHPRTPFRSPDKLW